MHKTNELQTLVAAAAHHIDVQQAHHADAVEYLAGIIATGDDDTLEEAEAAVAHYAGLVSRAKARHASLVKQLADSEANDRKAEGEAAQAEADSLLAEVQGLLDESALYSAKLSEITLKAKPLLDKANEKRRWVVHCGVQLSRPTLKAPDIGPALEAAHTIARLPGAVWTNLYG